MKITAGMYLTADTEWKFPDGSVLRYNGADGNLVWYGLRGFVRWALGVVHRPGRAVVQHDGNFCVYDEADQLIFGRGEGIPGSWLEVQIHDGRPRLRVVRPAEPVEIWGQDAWEGEEPGGGPGGPGEPIPSLVRKLVGLVRQIGRSFGDHTGPCHVHGCTDFGAVVKFHEDPDASKRSLDLIAAHQQFVRAAWRLNGWKWTTSGLTLDPIRDSWWEAALRGFLQACDDRGLRVMLTCADMNDWSMRQAEESIRRTAQIAGSVSPHVVWLHEWNELRSIWRPGDENEDQIRTLQRLSEIWREHYPWSMRGLSDPDDRSRTGLLKLSRPPATCALIHGTRWPAPDAIRHTFNMMYEGYMGLALADNEPTGPNGSPPHGEFTRLVTQPTESPSDLAAIYTMHILTGQSSTYLSDPGLCSRLPLDSTWGFKELPALWRMLEIPQDIGQGRLFHGGLHGAPLNVQGSDADRADSVVAPDGQSAFGVISGTRRGWRVRAGVGWGGEATLVQGDQIVWSGQVSEGEVLSTRGPVATIVRIRR